MNCYLAYSLLQQLTPSQRRRLAEAQMDGNEPSQPLSSRETED